MAYAIKTMPKKGFTPEGYDEYTVYPLEGLWELSEYGEKEEGLNKEELVYTIMIRQPDFVTKEVLDLSLESTRNRKSHPYLNEIRFDTIEDGLSVQMLHIGPYTNEPETLKIMEEFTKANRLERASSQHREIYLSDPQKVEPEKLRTILRYRVLNKSQNK